MLKMRIKELEKELEKVFADSGYIILEWQTKRRRTQKNEYHWIGKDKK